MPTIPTSAPSWCSGEARVKGVITGAGVFAPADPAIVPSAAAELFVGDAPHPSSRRAPRLFPHPPSTTTRGSSSPRGRPGVPKGVAVRASVRRRVRRCRSTPVPAGRPRSAPAIACSPASRSRSTRRVRRCGSRGATGRASYRRRARSCARAKTSVPGWSDTASPSSRPCRRSRRSGRRTRSRTCVC